MFLWMVGLEVIKQVCCVSRVCKGTIANPTNNLFLVSNSTIFIDRKTEVLPHFAFARSVLSLTEELEDSSIAIFTAYCLAFMHVHALVSDLQHTWMF